MFSKNTFAIVYGLQLKAIQNMLDFDFLCGREPSVLGIVNPQNNKTGNHKIFFGDKEIFIPSYPSFSDIPDFITKKTDTLVNFASHRSAFDSTLDAMGADIFKNIVIIAEGIPERETREIIARNKEKQLNIIGPATVGAMKAGVFRAGNTGGSIQNIVDSKLYQTGSVGFVSKSGGMSNELRRVIGDRTNGSSLSIALGGDAYNAMEFEDVFEIYEKDDTIKMIVMLGEVGGTSELKIAEKIKNGKITKPVVAWCIGTIDEEISGEIQFGHAGAKSNKGEETAKYKNTLLKESGAIVPESYMDFGEKISEVFESIPKADVVESKNASEIAKKFLCIQNRKPSKITSTISDERGDELLYNKKSISELANEGSIAKVIGHLWFKKDFSDEALDFLNTVLILLADHGPAVSGATNAIVTSRAGNDVKSSLISGLATIGPRFGGAIDGAAKYFFDAVQKDLSPTEFIKEMKSKGIRIPGIGHRVKSKFNPDKRCEILLKKSQNFSTKKYVMYALEVEKLTLEKKPNLILNVDGITAVMLLDILENSGMTREEIQLYIDSGIFNGLFILARSIGFIGHIIDQKRLGEGLYRTDWEDINYM